MDHVRYTDADVEREYSLPATLPRMRVSSPALERKEPVPLSLRQILGGRYFWWLLLYSVLLLAITGTIAIQRHLWWDEIEVYYVVTLPSLREVWRTLFSGVDWQPPTYYLPLYYLCKWFGASSLVLRSIAIVPYWLATLILYVIVARRATPLHGFLAMLLPSLTLAFAYAFEARPYALVLLFTACAFLSWQLTGEQHFRRFALPALALSLGAAFAVHYNACLVALPLLVGEGIRAARRRTFDFPVLLSLSCGALPAVFLLPHILLLRHYLAAPSPFSILQKLSMAYDTLFFRPIVLSIGIGTVLAVWFALPRKQNSDRRVLLTESQTLMLAVSAAFLAIPVAYCAISYFSGSYYPRYVLETVIGAAIFTALTLHGIHRLVPRLAGVLLAVVLLAVVYDVAKRLRAPDESEWGTFRAYHELFNRNTKALYDSRDPLLLGQGPYLVALRYGDEDLRDRAVHLLSDAGANAGPLAQYDRKFFLGLEPALPAPSHLFDYGWLKRQHRRVLLYNPDGWLLDRLMADGQELKIDAFLEQGPLYSVVMK
jgi:hypothetical protein